jgi:hypothetical protein
MKSFLLLILLVGIALALLVPLHPRIAGAQPEATPILGEPVTVTPVISPVDSPGPPTGDLPAATPPASTSAPVPSATTAASVSDACEPNDTPEHACPLPLDTISGPFTFVPDSDQDFFRLDLPEEASIQTVITVRATAGLDLLLSVRQGDTLRASGTYSVTLAPEVAGSVVLRVENRDPRPAAGEQYRIEVRREIIPPPDSTSTTAEPDALENNWSFDTAPPIAVGVVYDLNFVCPDPRLDACPGGDHDHLFVPVKAGMRYLITTFDLDPGVDTVVELFWGTMITAVAGNDDYAPGGTLSALTWVAPTDGLLGVRIAPRNGGLMPHLTEGQTGYRFAVAPVAGELARKLEATIRQQANVPAPTATSAPITAQATSPVTPHQERVEHQEVLEWLPLKKASPPARRSSSPKRCCGASRARARPLWPPSLLKHASRCAGRSAACGSALRARQVFCLVGCVGRIYGGIPPT